MIQRQNIPMVAGDTTPVRITIKTKTGYKDLTGATIKWAVRKNDITSALVLQKSTTAGNIIIYTPASDGIMRLVFTAADTVNLLGDYIHQVEITDATGDIRTVCEGSFSVMKSLVP